MKPVVLAAATAVLALSVGPLFARHRHHEERRHAYRREAVPAAEASPAGPPVSTGTWGLGVGYLPASYSSTIPTVTGDYWLAGGNLALEGGLGFGTFTGGPEGTNASGGAENSASNDFGLSAGARYVILRPTPWLWVEGIGRIAYTNSYSVTPAGGTEYGTQTGGVGVYAGAGVEVFLPFLRNLSLSLDSGLNAGLDGVSAVGAGTSYTQSRLWLGGSGMGLPFTFSAHAYF